MKLTTLFMACVLAFVSAACSTTGKGERGPNAAGLEVTQYPGHVNQAKVFRLKDNESGVVCYGAIASEDSANASAGHFQCLHPAPAAAPAANQKAL